MFRHFINCKFQPSDSTSTSGGRSSGNGNGSLTDDGYYDLFDARSLEKSENKTKTNQNIENLMKNCRIINKKAKTIKERFKDFLNN